MQTAFLAGLLGATGESERTITLTTTRNGRLDLLVLPHGTEQMAVVVEIKSTSWDQLAEHRLRPNLRAHIRQLQNYLDVYVAGLTEQQDGKDMPEQWDSVVGVLLYPHRPTQHGPGSSRKQPNGRRSPSSGSTKRTGDQGADAHSGRSG